MNDAPSGRLRWKCRRGMKELDVLLTRFLDTQWNAASSDERAAFDRFLDLPDPDLAHYLLDGAPPPEQDFASLARRIRG